MQGQDARPSAADATTAARTFFVNGNGGAGRFGRLFLFLTPNGPGVERGALEALEKPTAGPRSLENKGFPALERGGGGRRKTTTAAGVKNAWSGPGGPGGGPGHEKSPRTLINQGFRASEDRQATARGARRPRLSFYSYIHETAVIYSFWSQGSRNVTLPRENVRQDLLRKPQPGLPHGDIYRRE